MSSDEEDMPDDADATDARKKARQGDDDFGEEMSDEEVDLAKVKTGLLKRSQKYELVMLRLFLVIFFANYFKVFHKTEVLTVILRCITCLNLN